MMHINKGRRSRGEIIPLIARVKEDVPKLYFFFFFQAEDGIRDYKVTGVQTCALPICLPPGGPGPCCARRPGRARERRAGGWPTARTADGPGHRRGPRDRKSTRLNSSHLVISYAVFCLKKKKLEAALPWHTPARDLLLL